MFSVLRAAGLCLCLPAAASAGSVLPGVSDLLWFGDSLSDPGNAFVASGGTTPDPAFYPDRQYTNGDTWAVQLGADLASGKNYAFGGARAATNGDSAPDFAAQVASFAPSAPGLGPDPAAVVAFGGNDLRDAVTASDPAAVISAGIGSIAAGVAALADLGVERILVANVPNLGRLPGIVGTVLEPVATAATVAFNRGVEAQLAALPTDARIDTLDLFAIGEAIAADPGAFGLDNTTEPCLTPVSFCGTEAAGYAYYDPIHPTETIHAVWAEAAAEALAPAPAPVPLPAGGALLVASLLALGYFRRRSVQI